MRKDIELVLSDQTGISRFLTDKFSEVSHKYEDKLINQHVGIVNKSETKLTQVLDATQTFIEQSANNAVSSSVEQLYKQLGINQGSLAEVKNITNILSGSINKVQTIINIMPRGLTQTPSVHAALMNIAVSYKDILMEQIYSLKVVYDESVNAAINSTATVLQLLQGSQEVIIKTVEELFEHQIYQYTGHHIIELYYILQPGIQLIKAILRQMKGRKDIREKIKGVQEEATDKAEQELDKTINNVLGNKIGMTHTLNVDLDANELYKELNIWLSKQSDALYNAFMMLLMKDFVNLIKEDIQKLTNIDIRLLGDNLNTFDDLIYLLDMLGLNETTPTLPLESILTTGLNSVFAINNSFKTMLREIDVPKLGQLSGAVVSSLDAQATTRPAYEIDTKIEGENNIINIKLHANPKNVIVRNQLSLLFKRLKYNKKRIFDNGQVNTILDNMYAIYSHYVKEQEERKKIKDTDSSYNILKNKEFNNDLYKESDFVNNNTFIIKALVDKSPKIYTFVIDIDNPQDFVKPNVNVKSDKDIKKEIPDEVKQQIEKAKYESLIYQNLVSGKTTYVYTTDQKRRNTFDIVKQIFLALKPISSLLKKVSKLIENYKINKQTVQNHAHTDLVLSFKNVMKKLGLHKEYDIKGKNIYTVRTKKLYDYCIHTLNIPHVNTTAFSEISADNTNKLIEYLKVEKIPANDLKKDIITVLYFDTENINAADSIAVDGTINGLDKIEIVKDANAVLYSDNNRSTTSSQILRAMRLNLSLK